jgi:hypothetical protein
MRQRSIGETSMANANEALRRSDDALKRIEALEGQLERALRRINALEMLVWDASSDVDELAVSLGEPSP